ncbi:MAG: FAD-dependent monooxygenase [Nitrospiraceae bacterium]
MPTVNPRDQKVVIIGGGPAGLTAAYQLSKVGAKSVVLASAKNTLQIAPAIRTTDFTGGE